MLAHVDGWTVIVGKEDFTVGDKCIYFEIDSILPDIPFFSKARSRSNRIKTMKMGGVYSQGFAISLSDLSEVLKQLDKKEIEVNPGDDLTGLLQVEKYESFVQPVEKPKYKNFLSMILWKVRELFQKPIDTSFPFYIQKTDEVRCENMLKQIQEHSQNGMCKGRKYIPEDLKTLVENMKSQSKLYKNENTTLYLKNE